jgi:hypothetical protein
MAWTFAGGTTGLTLASAPITAVPLTMSCAFFPTLDAAEQMLMAIANNATDTDYFALTARLDDAGDPLEAQTRSTAAGFEFLETTNSITLNAWNIGVGVWRTTTDRSIYLNGLTGSADGTTDITPASLNRFAIARNPRSSDNQNLTGRIAEAAMWNVALDTAEVAALCKGVSPRLIRPQSLVGYWPCFANDASELDRSENANNLTLAGAPTKGEHPRVFYG